MKLFIFILQRHINGCRESQYNKFLREKTVPIKFLSKLILSSVELLHHFAFKNIFPISLPISKISIEKWKLSLLTRPMGLLQKATIFHAFKKYKKSIKNLTQPYSFF